MAGLLGFGAPNTTYNSQIPTIAGLYAQTSAYGIPLPIVYGRNKLSGNVIFLGALTTYDASSGVGKGGGSASSTGYRAAVQLALCEGPLSTADFPNGIARVWNGQTLMGSCDLAELPPGYPALKASPFETVMVGTRSQAPWSYFGVHVAGQAMVARNFSIQTSKQQLENGTGVPITGYIQYNGGNSYTITDPGCVGIAVVQVVWPNGQVVHLEHGLDTSYIDLVTALTPSPTSPPPAGSYYVSGTGASTTVVCTLPSASYATGTVCITYYVGTDLSYASIGYGGTALLCAQSLDLGTSGAVPQYTVEVAGRLAIPSSASMGARDAAPGGVIVDLLTNAEYGAGWGVQPWDVPVTRVDVTNGITPNASDPAASGYARYCQAMDWWISPVIADQQAALDHLEKLLESTNASCLWTAGPDGLHGMLRIVPLGDSPVTGNGVTYTPNTTPIYDLGPDCLLVTSPGEPPITIETASVSDTWNSWPIEYLKRDTVNPANGLIDPLNAYSPAIEEDPDAADVASTGLRRHGSDSLHAITRQSHAQVLSRIKAQRSLYCATKYTFRLPFTFHILEPLDIVTLTDPLMGLAQVPVRIKEILDRPDGSREITAEAWPFGVASAAAYQTQIGEGIGNNRGTTPYQSNPPILTVPPLSATENGTPELWVATAAGTSDWGGAQVWLSWDGGASYSHAGDVGPATYGTLAAALPSGPPIDTVNTMQVDLRASGGYLATVSQADRDALVSECWVDGEVIAFQTATLASAYAYNLTSLRRGCLGTMPVPHVMGAPFLKVDANVLRVPVDASRYGVTVYVKLASYNLGRTVTQDLSTVIPTQYTLPSPKAAAAILPDLPVKFTFDTFDREDWDLTTSSALLSLVSGGIDGGNALEVSGDLVAIHKSLIPVNATTLYGLSAQFRQQSDASSGGQAFSIGFLGVAGDGVTFVDPGGGATQTGHLATLTKHVADGWTGLDAYWQGRGATGAAGGTIAAPGAMQLGVRYVRLMVCFNQSGGNGIQDLDALSFYDAAAQAALARAAVQTYYSASTVPPSGTIAIGSLWFQTDQAYQPFRWDGSVWAPIHDASPIVASQIATGLITADKLNINDINAAGTITVGQGQVTGLASALGGKIAAGGAAADVNAGTTQIAGSKIVSIGSGQVTGLGALATMSSVGNGNITSIDGGKITTGTIDAARISTINIATSSLTLGGVTTSNAWFAQTWMASGVIGANGTTILIGYLSNMTNVRLLNSNTELHATLTNVPAALGSVVFAGWNAGQYPWQGFIPTLLSSRSGNDIVITMLDSAGAPLALSYIGAWSVQVLVVTTKSGNGYSL